MKLKCCRVYKIKNLFFSLKDLVFSGLCECSTEYAYKDAYKEREGERNRGSERHGERGRER